MNAQITILEPEQLEYLPAKTLLRLVETHQKMQKNAKVFNHTVSSLPELFRALEEMDIEPRFQLDDDYVAVVFTGDGSRLAEVWKLLRRHGYNTTTRPEKGDTTFYAFWHGPEGLARIFLQFSSSVCRRVQVGTKMAETPIYETQCGDLTGIEAEAPPVPAVVEDANEIPF